MKVSNLESPRSGNPVANQFVIVEEGHGALGNFIKRETFQSYKSVIATVVVWPDGRKDVTLDSTYWNYSRTTSKYLHLFLLSHGINMTTKEKEKALEDGTFKSDDLN